jgi:fimbrial chaperone protein
LNGAATQERAYRIIVRELPRRNAQGAVLGFTLEMSLPVFVTPRDARPTLDARVDMEGAAPILRLSNLGGAHAQIATLHSDTGESLRTPRYVLPGASFDIVLPNRAAAVRLATLDGASAPTERVIDVHRPTVAASVR